MRIGQTLSEFQELALICFDFVDSRKISDFNLVSYIE